MTTARKPPAMPADQKPKLPVDDVSRKALINAARAIVYNVCRTEHRIAELRKQYALAVLNGETPEGWRSDAR